MRHIAMLAGLSLAIGLSAASARAITDGTQDSAHTYVGAVMYAGSGPRPVTLCTGTLISPTVFLTAAHCVAPAYLAEGGFSLLGVSFAQDVTGIVPIVGVSESIIHPGFPPDVQLSGQSALHDVAILLLAEPVINVGFAQLPELGQLSDARTGRTDFTRVGYGLQRYLGNGNRVIDISARYVARSNFIAFLTGANPPRPDVNSSMLIHVTGAKGTGGGGCYGDSGGPLLLGSTNVVVGVFTTTGTPSVNCVAATNYVRLDTVPILSFIQQYI